MKCKEGKMKETLGNLANVRLPRVSGASEGAKGTLLENECVLKRGRKREVDECERCKGTRRERVARTVNDTRFARETRDSRS